MKMHSQQHSKILNHFLLGLISVATLPYAPATPTTLSPTTTVSVSKTSVLQLNSIPDADKKASNDILFGNQQTRESFTSDNSVTDEKTLLQSHKTLKNKQNESSSLNKVDNGSSKHFSTSNINNNNSPEEQLTALSAHDKNTPSFNSLIKNDQIKSDLGDGTSLPSLSSTDSAHRTSNIHNNIDKNNLENGITQTTLPSIPEFAYAKEQQTQLPAPQYRKATQSHDSANRYKRSHYHNSNSLHSNLDDLLNMKRQRRALRYKRNTNYEDFLASLLAAAAEAKYNDNYNTYPSSPTNEVNLEVNPQILYYLLTHTNQDEDNYVDLDKLSQYYYDNVLPLLEIDSETDSTSSDDDVSQELPVVIEPYAQQVIPVLPYPMLNRYQRIRRSYYKKYQNPLSVYSGLKRKRGRNNSYNYDADSGQWGRIVGGRNERSTYEDDSEEANKIYSLATLLATGKTAEDYSQRYKRSVKPVMNIM